MSQRGIQSVEVGGRLLIALADAGRPMALKDLALAAGMSPPKAHPYLVSFGKLGLITQDAVAGHYGLGPLAMQLGLISLQQFDPLHLASARLPALALEVGQTVAMTSICRTQTGGFCRLEFLTGWGRDPNEPCQSWRRLAYCRLQPAFSEIP